jgi:hypothetical protein
MYADLKTQQAAVLKELAALEVGELTAFQKALDGLGLPRLAPAAPKAVTDVE